MIGENIKKFREKLGLSQEDLANKIGMHSNTIARWERDEVSPRGTSMWKLAEALNISAASLLTGDINTPTKEQEEKEYVEYIQNNKGRMKGRYEKFGERDFYHGASGMLYSPAPPRGMEFWGSVLDAAEFAAERNDQRELSRIFPLIDEAYNVILNAYKKQPADLPVSVGASRSA